MSNVWIDEVEDTVDHIQKYQAVCADCPWSSFWIWETDYDKKLMVGDNYLTPGDQAYDEAKALGAEHECN